MAGCDYQQFGDSSGTRKARGQSSGKHKIPKTQTILKAINNARLLQTIFLRAFSFVIFRSRSVLLGPWNLLPLLAREIRSACLLK